MAVVPSTDCQEVVAGILQKILADYSPYIVYDELAIKESGRFGFLLDEAGFEIRGKNGKCNSQCKERRRAGSH